MKVTIWIAPASWALLCAGGFQVSAQAVGGGGRGGMLSPDDRAAVREAIRGQNTKLRADLRPAQKATVETALSEDAQDDEV